MSHFVYDSAKSQTLSVSSSNKMLGFSITEIVLKPTNACDGLSSKTMQLMYTGKVPVDGSFMKNGEESVTHPVLSLLASLDGSSTRYRFQTPSYTATFRSPVLLSKRPITKQWFTLDITDLDGTVIPNVTFVAVVKADLQPLDARRCNTRSIPTFRAVLDK